MLRGSYNVLSETEYYSEIHLQVQTVAVTPSCQQEEDLNSGNNERFAGFRKYISNYDMIIDGITNWFLTLSNV